MKLLRACLRFVVLESGEAKTDEKAECTLGYMSILSQFLTKPIQRTADRKQVLKQCVAVVAFVLMLIGFASQPIQAAEDDILRLQLKDGVVSIRLRPDLAPLHVEQIKKLVRDGAYDNVAFHRVIDGFMAQTGDVEYGQMGTNYNENRAGTGGSKYGTIKAEFSNAPFRRGTLGMARSQNPDSANSQFFICFEDAPHLNGQYSVIGEVVKGMEFVDNIKKGSPANNGTVSNPDVIVKASLAASVE